MRGTIVLIYHLTVAASHVQFPLRMQDSFMEYLSEYDLVSCGYWLEGKNTVQNAHEGSGTKGSKPHKQQQRAHT